MPREKSKASWTLFLISPLQIRTSFCYKKKRFRTIKYSNDKESQKDGRRTKCGNLPCTRQWRHLTPNLVRSSFPSLHIDKEVPRLPITKGRVETIDHPRLPIPRMKLKIPVVSHWLQLIEVRELI